MALVISFRQLSEQQAYILFNLTFAASALIKTFLVFTSLTGLNSS